MCFTLHRHHRSTGLIFIPVFLLFLCGCASNVSKEVAAFSAAAQLMLDTSEKGFEEVGKAILERKIYSTAANKDEQIDEDIFKEPFQPQIKLRLDYLRKLNRYAVSLGNLASADHEETINASSAELVISLQSLATTAGMSSISEEAKEAFAIFGTATGAVMKSLVERKKIKALKGIVDAMDEPIQKTSIALEKDVERLAPILKSSYSDAYSETVAAYHDERGKINFNERLTTLITLQKLHNAIINSEKFATKLIKSLPNFAKAHAQLKVALEDGKLTLDEVIPTIEKFTAEAEDLKNIYNNLLQNL